MAEEQKVRELLDRGLTHYGLGQVQEALDIWQQALELDPQNVRAREYIEFVRMSWGPQAIKPSAAPQPPAPGVADAAPPVAEAGQESPDADSSFFAPPAAKKESPPPAPAAAAPSSRRPPVEQPQGATGWGELFSGGLPPATEEPAAEAPWPAGTTLVSSTLPPHPASLRPAEPVPAPVVAVPPPVIAGSEPAFTDTATVPYQAVPTKLCAAVPLEPATPPEPADTFEAAAPALDALDLVAGGQALPEEHEATSDVETWLKGASDLLALDDFSGAIELLDKILSTWPDNQPAIRMREQASRELGAMFRSKIGDFAQVPRVRMAADEIIWLNLDHRAGFLLSLIDGRTSYDEIISVCGLSELEALRLFAQLLQEGVIEPV